MPNTSTYTDDSLIHHLYLTMRAFTKGVNDAMKSRPVQLRVDRPQLRRQARLLSSVGHRRGAGNRRGGHFQDPEQDGAERTHRADEQPRQAGKTHFPHRKGPGAVSPGSPGRRRASQCRLSGPLAGQPAADAVLHPVHAGPHSRRLIHTKKLQHCKPVVFTTDRYLLCHYT